jgi:predicted  nucleic acid-binding Zn-ribbon protein
MIENPVDFNDLSKAEENNAAMNTLLQFQNEQSEHVQAMMDKNNVYFPGEDEVEEMKKKQAEQSSQIDALLANIAKQKSDPNNANPEVARQMAAFEEQLLQAKMHNDNLKNNINSNRFEEIKVQKIEKIV